MRFRRQEPRPITSDELAALGRPRMIADSLWRAELMRPDLHERVTALAESRGDTSDEAMFSALKEVWSS